MMIKDMANILTMAARMEYLTIQRTIRESNMEYDRYSETMHHKEQRRYSDALAVVRLSSNVPSPSNALSLTKLAIVSFRGLGPYSLTLAMSPWMSCHALRQEVKVYASGGRRDTSLEIAMSKCCFAVKWLNERVLIDK